jgi:asparagine N-glycosylation enzyme membrane subunit Stt3
LQTHNAAAFAAAFLRIISYTGKAEKTMQKSTLILTAMVCFLSGIILGFLMAPAKKGMYCGNNNGNVYGTGKESEEDCKDVCSEDDLPF